MDIKSTKTISHKPKLRLISCGTRSQPKPCQCQVDIKSHGNHENDNPCNCSRVLLKKNILREFVHLDPGASTRKSDHLIWQGIMRAPGDHEIVRSVATAPLASLPL